MATTTIITVTITDPDAEGTYTAYLDGAGAKVDSPSVGYGASPEAAMADLLLDFGRALAGGLIDELTGGWDPSRGALPGALRVTPEG